MLSIHRKCCQLEDVKGHIFCLMWENKEKVALEKDILFYMYSNLLETNISPVVWYVTKGTKQVLRKNSSSFCGNNTTIACHLERKGHKKSMVTIKRLHSYYLSIYQSVCDLIISIYHVFLLYLFTFISIYFHQHVNIAVH